MVSERKAPEAQDGATTEDALTQQEVEAALRKSLAEAYIEVFQAVSDINRLRILALIASNPDDYPCTDLEQYLSLSKSTISYHIKILSRAGLLQVRKDGRNYRYTLRRQIMEFFLPGFEEKLLNKSIPLEEME